MLGVSDPADYTVHQALDPGTDAVTLHAMATRRPDLQQFVAANPGTPPEVLDWLGRLGQPAIDAALRRRATGAAPGAAPPAGPVPAPVAPASPYPGGQPAPYAGSVGTQPYAPAGQHANPYAPRVGPYAAAAGGGGGRRAGMVVAIVVAAALVVAGIVGVVVWQAVDNHDRVEEPHSGLLPGNTYGDNAELDEMWDDCEGGDAQACDDLYMSSEFDSGYEDFGNTCGNRLPIAGWCVDEM